MPENITNGKIIEESSYDGQMRKIVSDLQKRVSAMTAERRLEELYAEQSGNNITGDVRPGPALTAYEKEVDKLSPDEQLAVLNRAVEDMEDNKELPPECAWSIQEILPDSLSVLPRGRYVSIMETLLPELDKEPQTSDRDEKDMGTEQETPDMPAASYVFFDSRSEKEFLDRCVDEGIQQCVVNDRRLTVFGKEEIAKADAVMRDMQEEERASEGTEHTADEIGDGPMPPENAEWDEAEKEDEREDR